MLNIIKEKIIYIYILLFSLISYLSIYKTKDYIPKSLNDIYNKQIIWYVVGIIIIMLINKINIKKIYKVALPLYIISNIMLLLLFRYGTSVNNTRAWFNIGFLNIQPSEIMKVSLILMNASIIGKYYNNRTKISSKKEFKLILKLWIILLIPSILTFLEPDTGAVICYFVITLSMLYISGISKKWFIYLIIFISILLSTLFFIYYSNQDLFINIFGNNFFYRIERILSWQDKSGMQLNNSLISIGSSGLFGHTSVPMYYPEPATDFIFTSFASSYGLILTILFLITILSFDLYIINKIKSIKDLKHKYTIFGIIALIIYGQIQNIGMTLGILPIVGITLPFISYGGSSIITYLILLGIFTNIDNSNKKKSHN